METTPKNPSIPLFRTLFLPLLVEQLFGMLLGNIDVLMLSQYNDASVAATGLAGQLINIGLMVLGIASLGSGILLMQIAGTDRIEETRSLIRHGVYLNALIASAMTLVFLILGKSLLAWIQTPKDLVDDAYIYLTIVSVSLIFQSVMTSLSTVLRSFMHVRLAMYVSILTNIFGILGNYLVLFSPIDVLGRGIQGVAVATLLARLLGMLILVIAFCIKMPHYRTAFATIRMKREVVASILKLGFPSALENIAYTSSQTIITGIIASFGALMVTSKIYTQNITAIIFTIAAAISQANQIIVGRYIGAELKERARQYTSRVFFKSLGTGFVLSILVALVSGFIIDWMTDDPVIRQTVASLVWLSVLLEPGRLGNEIVIGALNTAGDVKFPTFLSVVSMFLFSVPLSYLVGVHWNLGLLGVWWVFIFDEWIRLIILYGRWHKSGWQAIDVFGNS